MTECFGIFLFFFYKRNWFLFILFQNLSNSGLILGQMIESQTQFGVPAQTNIKIDFGVDRNLSGMAPTST